MRVLLITPPMTQVNTPYPATAYLTGFLRERGWDAVQADLSLELFLSVFSKPGVARIAEAIAKKALKPTRKTSRGPAAAPAVQSFLEQSEAYIQWVEPVVSFLQNKDRTLAYRMVATDLLPRGPRFLAVDAWDEVSEDGMGWAFGQMGLQDQAQYLASLFIDDLADAIRDGLDPRFELSKYGEKLAASAPSFDPLHESLLGPPSLVDCILEEVASDLLHKTQPDVVALTVPFPGNVYGALRIAQTVRRLFPKAAVLLGGGYVNTELRELKDPRIFDFVDFITLDDGERPLLSLLEALRKNQLAPCAVEAAKSEPLLRTFVRQAGQVVLKSDPQLHDIPLGKSGTPIYSGLKTRDYVSLCEMPNPMHRLWSDGRWNKLTLAHGCYWKQCSFCDVTLDYIGRYEPQAAAMIVDRMQAMIQETGETGFHFVDEAAPPKLLKAVAEEILRRGLVVSWWGNIRFEKTFTESLSATLAQSGCIAMSGGLEVASDRLLQLMKKGVTVEQVARVTHGFSQNGILVHAYLMYGFPTQTLAETVDALERVRQLFLHGCIQSAFWHRFSATVHSPIGKNPDQYGIKLLPVPSTFAKNDVAFEDPTGVDHDLLYPGLKKALYNYMLGLGLEEDVRTWFDFKVPRSSVPRNFVASALGVRTPSHSEPGLTPLH
jgi:radical SAM superfamily enzyme YgiQ (UPF0313 family)